MDNFFEKLRAAQNKSLLQVCLSALRSREKQLKSSLLSRSLRIGTQGNIQALVTSLSPPAYDLSVAKHQLSAYRKREGDLRSKMQFLNREIEILHELTDFSTKTNRSNSRMSEEDHSKFLQRMRTQHLEIAQRRIASLQQRDQALAAEELKLREQEKEAKAAVLQQQKERLRATIAKSTQRRESSRKLKSTTDGNLRKVLQKPPLCEILELSFDSRRHMDYIRAKEEMKMRRHQLFVPMDKDEIDQFGADYMRKKRERLLEKAQKMKEEQLSLQVENFTKTLFRSRIADVIEEEECKVKLEESLKVNSHKLRHQRQKIYAQTVQKVFQPSISATKSEEMEQLRRKTLNPRLPSSLSARELVFTESLEKRKQWQANRYSSCVRLPPLSVKPYYESPAPKSMSISPKNCDYLQARKMLRQQLPVEKIAALPDVKELTKSVKSESGKGVEAMLQLLSKAESAAMRQELCISEGNPSQAQVVDCQERISQLYIDSIKAKLDLINAL